MSKAVLVAMAGASKISLVSMVLLATVIGGADASLGAMMMSQPSDPIVVAIMGLFGLIITTGGSIVLAKINKVHTLVNSQASKQDKRIQLLMRSQKKLEAALLKSTATNASLKTDLAVAEISPPHATADAPAPAQSTPKAAVAEAMPVKVITPDNTPLLVESIAKPRARKPTKKKAS